jgi:putative tryptophan/tyrosine transport system substrate-binding protein
MRQFLAMWTPSGKDSSESSREEEGVIDRRGIVRLGLLGGAIPFFTRLSCAQSPNAVRIGVLIPVPDTGHFQASLKDGLRDLGRIEATDFTLQVRQADGTVAAFHRLGDELVASSVDVLVTASTAAATALSQVTTTIPIVFLGAFDPVAAGLVDSLDHPGRNLTGIAGFQADIAAKWVAQLKELDPALTEMVIFSNPASVSPAALAGWKAVAAKATSIGEVHVDSVAGVDAAVAEVAQNPHAGMIVVPHTFRWRTARRSWKRWRSTGFRPCMASPRW